MDVLLRATAWAGWGLTAEQEADLSRLADWLTSEAIEAGGLGPAEGERVQTRHLADSLLFAAGWTAPTPPRSLIDLGTGVGLPGIPLAILWPATEVTLLDRGGRRVQLARRAVRILDLANVKVKQGDAAIWPQGPYAMVVARAAADPGTVETWARRLVAPEGVIVIGGSWQRPPAAPEQELLTVPAEVLDRRIWLRKIAPA